MMGSSGMAPYSIKSWESGAAAACQIVMSGGMMKGNRLTASPV